MEVGIAHPPVTQVARIRVDETDYEAALRTAIAIHCPDEDEMRMAARSDLAMYRDQATAGLRKCTDEAAGMLHEVVRLATPAVYAPWPISRLLGLKSALWMAMEAARQVDRLARDG